MYYARGTILTNTRSNHSENKSTALKRTEYSQSLI